MGQSLYWQQFGEGDDLILIHGWGMNGAVWQHIAKKLSTHFCVHIVDLPGYGYSADCRADNLEDIVSLLLEKAPERAVWVGWSLGGVIAAYIALKHAKRVSKLITVASSPKFAADKPWVGIKPQVLDAFSQQLAQDCSGTIERFMALQTLGSPSAKEDVKQLRDAVLSRPQPHYDALCAGLDILKHTDLREAIKHISVPLLSLYGRLDGLVPVKISAQVAASVPQSQQFVFTQSSHAPFMTETEAFCEQIIRFSGK